MIFEDFYVGQRIAWRKQGDITYNNATVTEIPAANIVKVLFDGYSTVATLVLLHFNDCIQLSTGTGIESKETDISIDDFIKQLEPYQRKSI